MLPPNPSPRTNPPLTAEALQERKLTLLVMDLLRDTPGSVWQQGNASDTTYHGYGKNNVFVDAGGNDTYLIFKGDGKSVIGDLSGSDTVRFGTGITFSDLRFSMSSADLKVSFVNSADQVLIKNWYSDLGARIENFKFADGSAVFEPLVSLLGVSETGTFSWGPIIGT